MTWKPIPKYPEYEANELGQIRRNGNIRKTNRKAYESITISHNGRQKSQSVHRLVYSAFHGEIPAGMHINHINGDRFDNRIKNLECLTPQENYSHARNHLVRRGEQVNTAKMTAEKVLELRQKAAEGTTTLELMEIYGLNKSSVNRIISRRNWSHV